MVAFCKRSSLEGGCPMFIGSNLVGWTVYIVGSSIMMIHTG
jgi:hypothetical protein